MTGFDHFSNALYKYSDFEGRASRSEYWYFVLFHTLFTIGVGLLGLVFQSFLMVTIIVSLFVIATFIPLIAVSARRLHDMGLSAWFLLLSLVPLGSIALLVMYCMDSQPYTNKWGPHPNYAERGYEDSWLDDDEVLEDFPPQRYKRRRIDDDDYV